MQLLISIFLFSLFSSRLTSSNIEEFIVKDNFNGTEEHFINFEEFLKLLKIPADDHSYTLFKIFIDTQDTVKHVIDLKEYLNHTLLLIKIQESKIELVRVLFMVSATLRVPLV